MGKWLFPLSLLIAALFIHAAALRVKKQPEPSVAAAYTSSILEKDPVYSGLKSIDSHSLRISKTAAAPRNASPPAIAHAEPSDGTAERREIFAALLLKSYDDSLRAALDETRAKFDLRTDAKYKSMITELESFSALLAASPQDESLTDKKFSLFNIRLKLDTLSRDKATVFMLKPEELEKEKLNLIKEIAEQTKQHIDSIAARQKKAADSQLADFSAEIKLQDIQLREEMNSRLAGSRTDADFILRKFDEKTAAGQRDAIEIRKRIRGKAASVQAVPWKKHEAPRAVAALNKYNAVLSEIIRRKAGAAAIDNGIGLVVESPLFRDPSVRDISSLLADK